RWQLVEVAPRTMKRRPSRPATPPPRAPAWIGRWAPGSSGQLALPRWLIMPPISVVALVAAAFFVQVQSAIPTIFDDDGYYHIKVAELTARNGILRSFPWAAFTPFRDHFGDKEFLFHVFLVPFTGLGLVQGAKLATVVLDAAIVALSYHLLRVRQVRGAPLWPRLCIGAAMAGSRSSSRSPRWSAWSQAICSTRTSHTTCSSGRSRTSTSTGSPGCRGSSTWAPRSSRSRCPITFGSTSWCSASGCSSARRRCGGGDRSRTRPRSLPPVAWRSG